jgi:hypothetical protein
VDWVIERPGDLEQEQTQEDLVFQSIVEEAPQRHLRLEVVDRPRHQCEQ